MKKLPQKRIAIYFNHFQSLGHLTRLKGILSGLKNSSSGKIDILVLYSGKPQNTINLEEYADLLYLPYSIGKEWFFLSGRLKSDPRLFHKGQVKELLHKRADIIKDQLQQFKPDVLITELFPFGGDFWYPALLPTLRYLKKYTKCRIISSVGDLAFQEYTYPIVKSYYDRVMLHFGKIEFNLYREFMKKNPNMPEYTLKYLRKIQKKFFLTDYVLECADTNFTSARILRKDLGLKKNDSLIIVSRGGGAVCWQIILYSIWLAKELRNHFFFISTGPTTGDSEFIKYKKALGRLDNVKLVKYTNDFMGYLNASQLSINMAGYNTFVRILSLRKKSLTIPYNAWDQKFRGFILEKMRLSKILPYERLSYDNFRRCVKYMLESEIKPNALINKIKFCGIENTVKIIKSFLP